MAPRKKPQAGPLSFDLGISYSMNKMKNQISPPPPQDISGVQQVRMAHIVAELGHNIGKR